MASVRSRIAQAAGLHRQAAAIAAAAERALAGHSPDHRHDAVQRELAERLRALAAELAPGWLGVPLKPAAASHPLGASDAPVYVRIGTAHPLDDAVFPVVVPLLRRGHLAIDADSRDPRVAGALRALLLRLLAAAPAGRLLVRVVDAATQGALFASFAPLADAGLMPPPVTDRAGLRAVLAEAEQWVRAGGSARSASPRSRTGGRLLLVVIASLPELTDGDDLARLATLAEAGPPAGLHLVVAGWPPPPLTAETTQGRLPLATQIGVRNPYAVVAGPPEASFGGGSPVLGAPIFLDDDPPGELVERVCRELAGQAAVADGLRLADVLPEGPPWTESSTNGLATVVGLASDTPITLRFNEVTPHWIVSGRAGSGKSAFLLDVLCGLSTRYGPDQLALYLLDPTTGRAFAPLLPAVSAPPGGEPDASTWLPQVRAAGVEVDPAYALAVLQELTAELERREAGRGELPRIVCVLDELPALLAGGEQLAEMVGALARRGGRYGVHLLLAGRAIGRLDALADRDSASRQFRVRVALPGGEDVLDAANDSAAGLPLGAAVVNTAGGLGGPRGATRGHETVVRFPDPYAGSAAVTALRQRLWQARPAGAAPPPVFVGSAAQRLADDPTYRAGQEALPEPTALLGRCLDAALSTASFRFDATPGRHLAILGRSEVGVDLLDAAARSLAAQHPPGQVRFLLAALAPGTHRVAEEVGAAVGQVGHSVTLVDRRRVPHRLREMTGAGIATYLVVFGGDALDVRQSALRSALREGPGYGHHLLAWWRAPRRYLDLLGPTAPEDVTGLVLLSMPAAEADLAIGQVVGQPVEWQPRPNRALLHDRRTGESTVFVPFLRPGRAP